MNIDDPTLTLLVNQFTAEGVAGHRPTGFGNEFLFMVGRDDVHGVLKWLLTHETLALTENMFGFDDQELNDAIMAMIKNPNIHVQLSLDKSQAAGVHEKQILDTDRQTDPEAFVNSITILQSATHQISHTKGAVLSGLGLYFEGSTNWSASGEGTGISLQPGVNSVKGYKAQNNTLLVSSNKVNLLRFKAQLDAEHTIGLAQTAKITNKGGSDVGTGSTSTSSASS